MNHFSFLEKISEGLFIEGFNEGRADADCIDLSSYLTEHLEDLVQTSRRRCQRPRGLVWQSLASTLWRTTCSQHTNTRRPK